MITKLTLTLKSSGRYFATPELGYRLYSALLEKTPCGFAERLHEQGVTPLSQFTRKRGESILWQVGLLGRDTEDALLPVLEDIGAFDLKKDGAVFTVTDRSSVRYPDANALFDEASKTAGSGTLTFHTPTAFKSGGKYISLPSSRLIIQSLIKKWNGCFPDCPIEDEDGEGMEAVAEGVQFRDFKLFSRSFDVKGYRIPGFVGSLTPDNRLTGFHRELANALLVFSGCAGIGIKTTLGMGGVTYDSFSR